MSDDPYRDLSDATPSLPDRDVPFRENPYDLGGQTGELRRARQMDAIDRIMNPDQSDLSVRLRLANDPIVRYSLTDASHAERFAEMYGLDVRFDHRRERWLMWDQGAHRWAPDADSQVVRNVIEFTRFRQKEALDIKEAKIKKLVLDWYMKAESRAQVERTLWFAKALRPIADAGDNWDMDPWLLCTPSGVVDLTTGLVRPGDPADRISMSTAVAYDETARCPRWLHFISEIFDGDAQLIEFAQRFVGYALTGVTYEQVLAFFFGKGANGKGTFMNTIAAILGDYAYTMRFETVEAKNRGGIPNDVAALEKRRFVIASETQENTKLNEGRIKSLTGSDPITARYLHGEFFTFQPVAKFVLAVNHKPRVDDTSYGFWRRIRLVPFLRSFQSDATVAQQFEKAFRDEEACGILRWAVEGCLKWQGRWDTPNDRGLTMPVAIVNATSEYQDSADPLTDFFRDVTEPDPGNTVQARDVYAAYCRWAELNGIRSDHRMTAKRLGMRLKEKIETRHGMKGELYVGIRLVTNDLFK